MTTPGWAHRLDGRVAVVTGAAQGIGAATARRLAEEGATVAVLDRNEAGATEVAASIGDAGGRALGLACDVISPGSVEAAVAAVVGAHQRVDVLVNNAGVTRDNLLFRMEDDEWATVLQVNLTGAFLMCRAVQRHMVAARYGRIVNLSSRSALGNRGQANYAAAKAGIQGLTATLAIELGPFNVTVNAVAPGYVATPMTAATAERVGMSADEHQRAAAERTPLRRVAQPGEVAAVIAFLGSDDASYVSGQTLYVNGGRAEMRVFESLDELPAEAGTELGLSDWHQVTQQTIDAFADATGDHQWIHVDAARAAAGPFGSTIAHGFLTLSLTPMLLHEVYEVRGARMAINYGTNRVRFPAPLPSGCSVRARVRLESVDEVAGGVQVVTHVEVEVRDGDKPCCVADMVTRFLR